MTTNSNLTMSAPQCPRPILKRNPSPTKHTHAPLPFSACGPALSPHVHFPPTPGLTSTHTAYSPQTYDRAPILVSPNICELPERHDRTVCTPSVEFEIERTERRGRSPSRNGGDRKGCNVKGSYFHPRAYEACELEFTGVSSAKPPPLVQDDFPSEDEEITTPPDSHPSSNARWSTEGGSAEETPILSDVYVTPVYTVRSTRSDDKPWDVTPDGKRRRPGLRRMDEQPSVKRVKEFGPQFSPHLDEGCLGGF